jgi:protein-L-isoaspartate(D-aspartate) O-methyltransferase
MSLNFEQARAAMIEQQVRPWDVLDPRVLEALMHVHREDYVAPAHRQLAFADQPLPLAHGECMLKPVVEGRLLQALALGPGDEVLEVGTGSGYFTACLARLARDVASIDRHADFVETARARLSLAGVANARLEHADLFAWQPGRQFDAIVLTGAVATVPPMLADWLRPGGRLVLVRGLSPVQHAVALVRGTHGLLEESLFETDIPYLHGAAPVPHFTL